MACSCGNTCSNCRKTGGRARRRYNQGGYLQGPSHEQGGIPANIQNGEQIELEGGEYIINAQTVNAVGTEFLDELNSTSTTYHQGGYQPGQLPNPSNYQQGGMIQQNNQVNFQRRRRPFRRQKMRPGRPHREMGGMVQQNNNLDWKRRHRRRKRPADYRPRRGKQMGGRIGGGMNNPITQTNLQAQPGQFVYQQSGQPYTGPYHIHQDGTFMIGAGRMGVNHEIKPHEVIVKSMGDISTAPNRNTQMRTNNVNNRYQQGGNITQKKSEWVYYKTNDPYYGNVIKDTNGLWFTTSGGTIQGTSVQVERRK